MGNFEDILQLVVLPITLPKDVFVRFGKKKRLIGIDPLLAHLPAELNELINLDGTSIQQYRSNLYIYFLPLKDGCFLEIKVENESIVGLAKLFTLDVQNSSQRIDD